MTFEENLTRVKKKADLPQQIFIFESATSAIREFPAATAGFPLFIEINQSQAVSFFSGLPKK